MSLDAECTFSMLVSHCDPQKGSSQMYTSEDRDAFPSVLAIYGTILGHEAVIVVLVVVVTVVTVVTVVAINWR